jgi:hypothetical protein
MFLKVNNSIKTMINNILGIKESHGIKETSRDAYISRIKSPGEKKTELTITATERRHGREHSNNSSIMEITQADIDDEYNILESSLYGPEIV